MKSVQGKKFKIGSAYIKEPSDLMVTLLQLKRTIKKQIQTKLAVVVVVEIIIIIMIISVETSTVETIKTIQRLNESKIWSFEKVNKISRLRSKGKKKGHKIRIQNEEENIEL